MKDDGNDLQEKCRERRRRRIEMRRLAGGSGSGSSSADAANVAECKKVRTGEEAAGVAADASPIVGTMLVAGRLRDMEDAISPDREDELARIRACGGRVMFYNGARVEGILAMSRAIGTTWRFDPIELGDVSEDIRGDKFLKAYVTSEPEISFTRRDPEDECLILASDGLWDVLSNDLACEIARECLREKNPDLDAMLPIESKGAEALYPSRSASTAALLTRLALGRKSSDNISVIVVDLKS
ncbi:hypothetical protein RJ639_027858 [Escallonia herrerae]|uniref:PPM-type phosphatase domain-containing protein n=1 Tax=Escallonia herrerae TaxID=1293975 RepID=A0AA88X5J2_9ASTE|nr:hypothetical protein RJ639_027858 [Escallonia herrerae]